MKHHFLLLLFTVLLFLSVVSTEQHNENPKLVFFVEHIDEPEIDYVEVSLTVETKDTSLTKAIKAGAS